MVIGTINNDVARLMILRMAENRILVVNILFLELSVCILKVVINVW